jgi:hypothetical protein
MAFDRQITALVAYCEASGASAFERRCVVHSIFNRVKAKRFQPTAAGVCLQRYQYSEMNDDTGDNRNLLRGANAPDNDPVMQDCLAAFDQITAGAFDPTGGATHYHDKSISPPAWTVGATMCLETPKFLFYRGVK